MNIMLILPILLPIIAGVLIQPLKLHDRKKRETYVSAVILINFAIVVFLALTAGGSEFTLLHLNRVVDISFKIDVLGIKGQLETGQIDLNEAGEMLAKIDVDGVIEEFFSNIELEEVTDDKEIIRF